MHKIRIKERDLYYFPAGQEIPKTITVNDQVCHVRGNSGSFPPDDPAVELVRSFPDVRAIVTTIPIYHTVSICFIWWFKENFGEDVDSLVLAGEQIPDYLLADTLTTEYHLTFCNSLEDTICRRRWHTLIISIGGDEVADFDLNEATARKNNLFRRCPNCGTYMRYPVVRVLDAADPPRMPDFR